MLLTRCLVCAALLGATGCAADMQAKSPPGSSVTESAPADAPMGAPPPPPPPEPIAVVSEVGGKAAPFRAAPREEMAFASAKKAPPGGAPQNQAPAAPAQPTPGKPKPTAPAQTAEAVAKTSAIIVYSAQLTMAVFEVNNAIVQIEGLGKEMGGFLAKREDTSIVIRVPADRFEDTVKRIERMGDMLHRNVIAEDVTEEFRDLEVRLKGAKAVQERLTQLLAKAIKVEDSVLIERELDRVTSDIDRIEGRMKFLRDRAAFSTITVTFQAKASEQVSQNPFRFPAPWLQQLGIGRLRSL